MGQKIAKFKNPLKGPLQIFVSLTLQGQHCHVVKTWLQSG